MGLCDLAPIATGIPALRCRGCARRLLDRCKQARWCFADEQPPELSFIARAARSHQEASELVQDETTAVANQGNDIVGDVICPNDLSIDNMLGNDGSMPDLGSAVVSGGDLFPALGPNDVLDPERFRLPHLDSQPSIEPEHVPPPTTPSAPPSNEAHDKLAEVARPSRRSNRHVVQSLQADDEDFIDAGAVDDGEDSDASEMSKEAKGDHDVKIEDFDRPVMESLQSLDEVTAALEGSKSMIWQPYTFSHCANSFGFM